MINSECPRLWGSSDASRFRTKSEERRSRDGSHSLFRATVSLHAPIPRHPILGMDLDPNPLPHPLARTPCRRIPVHSRSTREKTKLHPKAMPPQSDVHLLAVLRDCPPAHALETLDRSRHGCLQLHLLDRPRVGRLQGDDGEEQAVLHPQAAPQDSFVAEPERFQNADRRRAGSAGHTATRHRRHARKHGHHGDNGLLPPGHPGPSEAVGQPLARRSRRLRVRVLGNLEACYVQ